jgi:hypothetical protein
MIAFMAGHFGLPAKCAREREEKCKSERRQLDRFRSHNSCRSALRGRWLFFGFAAPRRKSNGWFKDAPRHGSLPQLTRAVSGRMRNRRAGQCPPDAGLIENRFREFVHSFPENKNWIAILVFVPRMSVQ